MASRTSHCADFLSRSLDALLRVRETNVIGYKEFLQHSLAALQVLLQGPSAGVRETTITILGAIGR